MYQVSITGPYEAAGTSETASRQRIFISRPTGPDDETACARQIFSALLHRAYRRPVAEDDLNVPMKFYDEARKQGGFEDAIEKGLCAILVNPQFLFRVEQDPPDATAGSVYRISDLELASRLSFFLWSSIPDDELLALAERNELSKPEVFEQQVRRMLADRRAENLATNFAGQWLYLRNLATVTPDMRLFPDFDDNLRQAFRQETELFFGSIVEEDRSVLDLLKANYTFLNERLAKHYGIPNIYGNRFRRVELADNRERGGLLRQGSILTVTSYATAPPRSFAANGYWRICSARRRRGLRPMCHRSKITRSRRIFRSAMLGRTPCQCRVRHVPSIDRPGRIYAGGVRRHWPLARCGRRGTDR